MEGGEQSQIIDYEARKGRVKRIEEEGKKQKAVPHLGSPRNSTVLRWDINGIWQLPSQDFSQELAS